MDRLTLLPRPSADMEIYTSIKQRGFTRYPERWDNYQKFQRARRDVILDYLDCPQKVSTSCYYIVKQKKIWYASI